MSIGFKETLLLILVLLSLLSGSLGVALACLVVEPIELAAVTEFAGAGMILVSLIFTIAVTFNINRQLIKRGSDDEYSSKASTLNNVLVFFLGASVLFFVAFMFSNQVRVDIVPVPLYAINWVTFVIACLVLMIDTNINRSVASKMEARRKDTFGATYASITYLDIPVLVGVGIACLAGTLMTIIPQCLQDISCYVNGFTAGAIAMQIVIANLAFYFINKSDKPEAGKKMMTEFKEAK